MKRFLVTLLVSLALPVAMLAQSASMMAMARAELEKRGLNETEVRARLLENGIDVDNIQPSEYANYQTRVLSILDQMQAEKANANGGTTVIVEAPAATTPAIGTEIPSTDNPAGNDIRTATLSKAAYQIVPGGKRRALNERMTCNAGLNE